MLFTCYGSIYFADDTGIKAYLKHPDRTISITRRCLLHKSKEVAYLQTTCCLERKEEKECVIDTREA